MPTIPVRSAAYTRTGILLRFLEQLAHADPGRVGNAYAEEQLGLKGGDIRAFLQSLRVLGLIDPYGQTTDRARRMRATTGRGREMREALREAYPELVSQWERRGGMPREEVEDFFKVEYGLSASSASPAAKLFLDLWREFSAAPRQSGGDGRGNYDLNRWAGALAGGSEEIGAEHVEPSFPPARPEAPATAARHPVAERASPGVRAVLHVQITADWNEEKINLLFDRFERLAERLSAGDGGR